MLRVATLNMLKETDRLSERIDLLVGTLKSENLDFLCLQEVPGPERAGFYVGDVLSYKLGMDFKVIGETKNGKYGNVTISRHPIHVYEAGLSILNRGAPVLVTVAEVDGRDVYIMNAHLAWGMGAEADRLRAASMMNRVAEDIVTRGIAEACQPSPVVFLAGDLNCAPESRTVRYLRGFDLNGDSGSTLWLDAWSEVGDHSQPGHTSGDPTHWAVETFKSSGPVARPDQMPKRRIDYVMSYGWVWGNPGQPVAARVFGAETFYDPELGDLTVSDHKGVIADFWTPEPEEA